MHSAKKLQRLLGDTLRSERTARAMSQEDLAEAAGLSRNYYGSVERGEKMPSVQTLIQIAGALKLTGASVLEKAKL